MENNRHSSRSEVIAVRGIRHRPLHKSKTTTKRKRRRGEKKRGKCWTQKKRKLSTTSILCDRSKASGSVESAHGASWKLLRHCIFWQVVAHPVVCRIQLYELPILFKWKVYNLSTSFFWTFAVSVPQLLKVQASTAELTLQKQHRFAGITIILYEHYSTRAQHTHVAGSKSQLFDLPNPLDC